MAVKSAMSRRKTVVFTTEGRLDPAASRTLLRFVRTCRVSAATSPWTRLPSGRSAIWPEQKTKLPARVACE
jgi:hypothetical protein